MNDKNTRAQVLQQRLHQQTLLAIELAAHLKQVTDHIEFLSSCGSFSSQVASDKISKARALIDRTAVETAGLDDAVTKVLVDRDELRTLLDLIFCHATNEDLFKRGRQMAHKCFGNPLTQFNASLTPPDTSTKPINDETVLFFETDLTELRDRFAGQAMPMAWAQENDTPTFDGSYKGVAVRAYLLADAMLAAREVQS